MKRCGECEFYKSAAMLGKCICPLPDWVKETDKDADSHVYFDEGKYCPAFRPAPAPLYTEDVPNACHCPKCDPNSPEKYYTEEAEVSHTEDVNTGTSEPIKPQLPIIAKPATTF